MLPRWFSTNFACNFFRGIVGKTIAYSGTLEDGTVNYVKGANIAGFMKVAKAMMAQGVV